MLSTNRISIKNEDLSASLISTASKVLGYTVVDAEKGPCKPVKISAGSSEKIHSIFGYTSAKYPMIQEALDFNAGYDLFISAPYDATYSKVGVAYVTSKGIIAADPVELNGTYIEDLSEDSDIDVPGITSNLSMKKAGSFIDVEPEVSSTGKTVTIKQKQGSQAVTLKAEDTLTIRTGTEERTVVIKASTEGNLEAYSHVEKSTSGTPGLEKVGTVAAGTITFNSSKSLPGDFFHEDSVGSNLEKSTFRFYQAGEDLEESTKVYAVIYQKYTSNRTTKISYKRQTVGPNKAFTFTVSEAITPTRTVSKNYTVSLDVSAKDGFGSPLGYDSVLADSYFVGMHVLDDDIVGAEFEDGSCSLTGTRVAASNLDDGWTFPEKPEYGDVDLFFNSETDPSTASSFFTLADRTSYPVQGFLFSLTPSIEGISPLTFGARYWNVCGKFTRVSPYTKEKYVSGLIGSRALMQAKIIENSYGGVAPMFLNENGLGGQLNVSVRKALNSWDKNEIDILTDNNYNPIIKDPTYGLMLVGQKTCQKGVLSDWSYIGHVSSFIALEKTLIDSVLIPQIGKPNNDYYRDLRKTQVESYLSPRISGARAIWADAIVDTSTREGVNDAEALAAKQFKIVVKVQPNIYSEYVTLTLASYPQGVELS